jgi:integrative and conjugative element protein (TIGR02256 family)
MTAWRGWTADRRYGVLIEASALVALDRMCGEAGRVETGGVLVGVYSADLSLAIVREVTPPPSDSRRGRSRFERGVAGLREMLRRRWRSKRRTYYLGEWHFHPAPRVEPSREDFAQMAEIAKADEYNCSEPLLVILGAVHNNGLRMMRAFVCPKGNSPAEFVADDDPRLAE